MNHSDEQHERCPNCGSAESTVPIITVNGTTLLECTDESCSGVRWRAETTREGLGENPDPRTVERLLNGAAKYRGEESLQALADDIARLYREPQTADDGRKAEQIPCPR